MNQISVAGSGVYALALDGIINFMLNWFGITPDVGSVGAVINAAVIVVGWVMIIVGQLRRKDLKLGLIRK